MCVPTLEYQLKNGLLGKPNVRAYQEDKDTMVEVISSTLENRWDLESFLDIYEEVPDAQEEEAEEEEAEAARGEYPVEE